MSPPIPLIIFNHPKSCQKNSTSQKAYDETLLLYTVGDLYYYGIASCPSHGTIADTSVESTQEGAS